MLIDWQAVCGRLYLSLFDISPRTNLEEARWRHEGTFAVSNEALGPDHILWYQQTFFSDPRALSPATATPSSSHTQILLGADEMNRLNLTVEVLETRKMLAGDVSVSVSGGGDLRIVGDNDGNELLIRATSDADRFVVEGVNGTTVNGQATAEFSGIDDDFRINLRRGNNTLALRTLGTDGTLHNFAVPDDFNYRSGSGNDLVILDDAGIQVGDDVVINTSSGDDAVFVGGQIIGRLRVSAGSGNDWLEHRGMVADRTSFSMGGGDDAAVLVISQFDARLSVAMGGGDDLLFTHDVMLGNQARLAGNGGDDTFIDCLEVPIADATVRFDVVMEVSSTEQFDQIDSEILNYPRALDKSSVPF